VQLSGVPKRVARHAVEGLQLTCACCLQGRRRAFGDIKLLARQAGSSSMPGKVNPAIPEVMNRRWGVI